MKPDDKLYKIFLAHIHELENFRLSYASMHPTIPLERDDPDVRRLTEALAYFAARTHMAGIRNISAFRRRIFQQFFPYLLTPLPAIGIVRAKVTGQYTEPVSLPKGTEIALASETKGTALFRTIYDLRILPISITELKMVILPNRGHRVFLSLQAPYSRNEDIGELRFHISHLNDFQASLRILHGLKKHLKRASVIFDEKITEDTKGTPCEVSFGAPHDVEHEEWTHPLQKERLFFHFPHQELFITLRIRSQPRNWSKFAICFDLDSQWPRSLVLNQDVFQLFAVPIVNLNRDMAQPVICDGTQERYSIRHPEPEYHYDLHSVVGVYQIQNGIMVPLRAGVLAGGSGSYELEETKDSNGLKQHWLTLHFPEAFEEPKTIAIDARWLQTRFSEALREWLLASLYTRSIVGLEWELVGQMMPHAENTFDAEMEGFLHLLTLKNKKTLNIDDLMGILQKLGSVDQGHFKRASQLLAEVRVEEAPFNKGGMPGMTKQVYYLRYSDFDPSYLPLVETFTAHVGRILDAWISEAKVEVRMVVS